VPLPGVTDSHGASSDALKLKVPPPVFATESVLAAGLAAPASTLNDSAAGATPSAGAGGAAATPHSVPDTGPSLQLPRLAQVAGSAPRLRPRLVRSAPPVPPALSRQRSTPPLVVGLSRPNQYAVPAVTGTGAASVTSFHAPGVTPVIVPEPRRLVGLPAASP
jgi:hypothetical protein